VGQLGFRYYHTHTRRFMYDGSDWSWITHRQFTYAASRLAISKRLMFVEDYRCRLQVAWMWGLCMYPLRLSRDRIHTSYILVTPRRHSAPPKTPRPGQSSLRVANVGDARLTFHPSNTHDLRTLPSSSLISRLAYSSSMIRPSTSMSQVARSNADGW